MRIIRNISTNHDLRRPARPAPLLVGLVIAPALAWAQQPAGCWVPYAEFEEHVRHIDAETCPPGGPAQGEGFCRLAVFQDTITVYEFREVGGQPCLTRVRQYALPDFLSRYGTGPATRPR